MPAGTGGSGTTGGAAAGGSPSVASQPLAERRMCGGGDRSTAQRDPVRWRATGRRGSVDPVDREVGADRPRDRAVGGEVDLHRQDSSWARKLDPDRTLAVRFDRGHRRREADAGQEDRAAPAMGPGAGQAEEQDLERHPAAEARRLTVDLDVPVVAAPGRDPGRPGAGHHHALRVEPAVDDDAHLAGDHRAGARHPPGLDPLEPAAGELLVGRADQRAVPPDLEHGPVVVQVRGRGRIVSLEAAGTASTPDRGQEPEDPHSAIEPEKRHMGQKT
jgi:hypothetical protein